VSSSVERAVKKIPGVLAEGDPDAGVDLGPIDERFEYLLTTVNRNTDRLADTLHRGLKDMEEMARRRDAAGGGGAVRTNGPRR